VLSVVLCFELVILVEGLLVMVIISVVGCGLGFWVFSRFVLCRFDSVCLFWDVMWLVLVIEEIMRVLVKIVVICLLIGVVGLMVVLMSGLRFVVSWLWNVILFGLGLVYEVFIFIWLFILVLVVCSVLVILLVIEELVLGSSSRIIEWLFSCDCIRLGLMVEVKVFVVLILCCWVLSWL